MYLRIDENFASHPKTIAFVGRMQDPNAAMYLIKLWTWAVRSCPDGDLTGMLPWSIEDVVGYRLQDGKCYAAMVASGFIDERETEEPVAIHRWMERTGGDVVQMEKEADRKRAWRLHRSNKCDPAKCVHCREKSGAGSPDDAGTSGSTDGQEPETSASRPPDDPDQGKARQGKSGSGSPPLVPRGSGPTQTRSNEEAKPFDGFALQRLFAKARSRIVDGAMDWQTPPVRDGRAAAMADVINGDPTGADDVVPTMELFLRTATEGRRGPQSKLMTEKPAFGFAAWCTDWTALREEIRAAARKASQPKKQPLPVYVAEPRPKFIPAGDHKPVEAADGARVG